MLFKRFDAQKTASLDVDAENGFTTICPDELPVIGGENIVKELNAQAMFARLRVCSKDAHPHKADYFTKEPNKVRTIIPGGPHKNMDVFWPAHCRVGTKGFELLPGLPSVTKYNFIVYKGLERDLHPYGACFHDMEGKLSTGLIEFLKYNNITTVIVGGLALDFCVTTTVLQLLAADFRVIVNIGACRSIVQSAEIQVVIQDLINAGAETVLNASMLKTT